MVQAYKPKASCHPCKSYSAEPLEKAVRALRSGKMSVRNVQFDVTHQTMNNHVRGQTAYK